MLTPKEKAIELYKYYNWELMPLAEDPTEIPEIAKKCAIKCVDEMLISLEHWTRFSRFLEAKDYYDKVKDELNKLSI